MWPQRSFERLHGAVTSQKEILMAKQPNIIDLHRQSTSINAWLLWEL